MTSRIWNAFARFPRILVIIAGIACASNVWPQTYPDRGINLIIPLGAGSLTDNIGRMVALKLSERIKQPVIPENKTGAGGMVALRALQAARPDGYTVGLVQSGSTIQPWTVKDFPFDVRKDFQVLTMMYAGPLMLVVPPNLPANNVTEFMKFMKESKEKAFYGSSGVGTTTHLAMALLEQSTGVDLIHVPFKGSADVYTNMLAGRVNAYFDLYGTAKTMVDGGRAKIIGVASKTPLAVLPNVPLISSAIPDFEVLGWTAFAVPNGTPKPVADKLATELRLAMADSEFRQRILAMGAEPGGNSAAEVAQFIAAEYDKWGRVTKAAGIKPE